MFISEMNHALFHEWAKNKKKIGNWMRVKCGWPEF